MKKKLLLVVILILVSLFAFSTQALALPPTPQLNPPTIVTQPQNQSITSLQTAELSIELSFNDIMGDINIALYRDMTGNGNSPDDVLLVGKTFIDVGTPYTWTVSPSDISGIGTYKYYFRARNTSTFFMYDSSDYIYSNVVTVEVTPIVIIFPMPSPEITTQPADATMTLGQSTTLTVQDQPANPGGGLMLWRQYTASYQWSYRNGTSSFLILYLGNNSPSLTVTPSSAGITQYQCKVTYTDNADSNVSNQVFTRVATVTTTAAPPAPAIVFNDVFTTDWFYDDVYTAVNMGLINGKYINPPMYVPNGNLTIAEAIKLAACMRQYYEIGMVTLTNGDPWYSSYVGYCGDYGIIGYTEYDGRYNDFATRAEYAMIFANFLPASEFTAINTIANGDIPDVTLMDSYGPAVYKLYNAGITQGDTSHAFNPNNNIKRSEVAAILTRMMDSNERKNFTI